MSSSTFRHKIPFSKNLVSAIVLAAGNSSRLGRPKQLVEFQGKTLIKHALEKALFAKFRSVFVVLGSDANLIKKEIQFLPVNILVNEKWEEGMGTSISEGIQYLETVHPYSEGVVLMACDQPFLTSDLLKELMITGQKTNAPAVACRYGESIGVPAFFSAKLFNELKGLKGGKGAKRILMKYRSEATFVDFPQGDFDIDTEADIVKLKRFEKRF